MVNAFWLDEDPDRTAAWLVDDHVTSSVFECSMVLTTAARANGYPDPGDDLYFTHPDHPLTRWAADALGNWRRLRAYVAAAHEEWRYRWDHGPEERHACWAAVESLDPSLVAGLDWPSADASDPPRITGRWTADDLVDAYRYYYANGKRHLFRWSKDRSEPPWLDEYTVDPDPEERRSTTSSDPEERRSTTSSDPEERRSAADPNGANRSPTVDPDGEAPSGPP